MIARRLTLVGLISLCLTVGTLLLGSTAGVGGGRAVIEGESFSGCGVLECDAECPD